MCLSQRLNTSSLCYIGNINNIYIFIAYITPFILLVFTFGMAFILNWCILDAYICIALADKMATTLT